MMMVLSGLRPDASLPEFLVHRARSASVRRLSIDLAVGAAGFAAALYWRPAGWLAIASLAVVFFAYGGWGIADRARTIAAVRENVPLRAGVGALCFLMGGVGAIAVATLLLSVWAIALGTWIS